MRTTKGKTVQRDQTVLEMVEEVLERQAKALADNTGQPFASALEIVARTEAWRRLRERLASGPCLGPRAGAADELHGFWFLDG